MGIADIRNAFVEAGGGQLHCTQARLRYGEMNTQILEFDGHHDDGTPFKVVSEPFDGWIAPQHKAREVAAKLLRPLSLPTAEHPPR